MKFLTQKQKEDSSNGNFKIAEIQPPVNILETSEKAKISPLTNHKVKKDVARMQ